MKKTAPVTPSTPLAMRRARGLNQSQFWNLIGVTQSGGSRYEDGRKIPKPVQTLLNLAYDDNPLAVLASLRGVEPADLLKQPADTATRH